MNVSVAATTELDTDRLTTMSGEATNGVPVAPIAGSVVGGIVVIAIVAVVVFMCCRHRSRKVHKDHMATGVGMYERGESRTEDNHGFERKGGPWRNSDIILDEFPQQDMKQRNGHDVVNNNGISMIHEVPLQYNLDPSTITLTNLGTGDDPNNVNNPPKKLSIGFEQLSVPNKHKTIFFSRHANSNIELNGYRDEISDRRQHFELSARALEDGGRWTSLDNPHGGRSESLHNVCDNNLVPLGFDITRLTENDIRDRCLSSNEINRGHWNTTVSQPLNPYYKSMNSAASSLGRDSGIGESQDAISHTDVSSLGSGPVYSDGEQTPDSVTDVDIITPRCATKLASDRCVPQKRNSMGPSEMLINRKRPRAIPESDSEDGFSGSDSGRSQVNASVDWSVFDPHDEMAKLVKKFRIEHNESHTTESIAMNIGGCTKNFAAAYFNEHGGLLRFSDGSASVNIPHKALKGYQLISMYAYYENFEEHGRMYQRRVIECGPEGMHFEKPVCVSFTPKLIDCTHKTREFCELEVFTSNSRNSELWTPLIQEDSFWNATPDMKMVTIHVSHFTRFTVAPKSFIQPLSVTPLHTGFSNLGAAGGVAPQSPVSRLSLYAFQKELANEHDQGEATLVYVYIVNDTEKFVDRTLELQRDIEKYDFFSALRAPYKMKARLCESDLIVKVINCHLCDVIGNHEHVVDADSLELTADPDPNMVERRFRVMSVKPDVDGSFEVAVYQENKKGPIQTISLCVNAASFMHHFRKASSNNDYLNYEDVLSHFNGTKIISCRYNSLFTKDIKFTLCENIDISPHRDWLDLAEAIGMRPAKISYLERYTHGKTVTPCYLLLDILEAQCVKEHMSVDEATHFLIQKLENLGYTRAVDAFREKMAESNKSSQSSQPQYSSRASAVVGPESQEENANRSRLKSSPRKDKVLARVTEEKLSDDVPLARKQDVSIALVHDSSLHKEHSSNLNRLPTTNMNEMNNSRPSRDRNMNELLEENYESLRETNRTTTTTVQKPDHVAVLEGDENPAESPARTLRTKTQAPAKISECDRNNMLIAEPLQTTANKQQAVFRPETFGNRDRPNDLPYQYRIPLSTTRSKNDSGIDSDTESQAPSVASNSPENTYQMRRSYLV